MEHAYSMEEMDGRFGDFLLPEMFFGPLDWRKQFGKMWRYYFSEPLPEQIELPCSWSDLQLIMSHPCPWNRGRQVKETHFLYYLPKFSEESNQLTGQKWAELCPKEDYFPLVASDYEKEWLSVYPFAAKQTARFSWYLGLKNIVPRDRLNGYGIKMENGNPLYEMPSFIECAPMYLLFGLKNKRYLNPDRLGYIGEYFLPNSHSETVRLFVGMFQRKSGLLIGYHRRYDCPMYPLGVHVNFKLYQVR